MTEATFYKRAAEYWANVPPTIDGVLGGFGHITDIDIEGSKIFLNDVLSLERPPKNDLALDCGAGIGRVTIGLLMHYFKKVDLVEQDEKFINAAIQMLGENNDKLGTVYRSGLQRVELQEKYDVIWCQWVLGHLEDHHLIAFLEKCNGALAENGVIVVKENIASSGEMEYDDLDSSVTRPLQLMKDIFDNANLRVIATDVQTGFPEDIYPVRMFALRPQ